MEWGAPSFFWILMLLLAFAVLGCFLFWVRQQNSEPRELVTPSFGGTDLIQSTTSIRTRADVVRAFHQLAVQIAYPIEFWWTANRVASRVDTSSPGVSSALQVAVSVYEQSRYLPDNAELTEEQLVRVRDAIHVLGSHAKGDFLGNAKGNDRTR